MCFPTTVTKLRTDEDFINNANEDHHHKESIMKDIPRLSLVSCVPLDYMHLVCLGVMRKILHLWMSGALNVRLNGKSVLEILKKIEELVETTPSDFARNHEH